MKQTFILDENTIVSAYTGTDPYGKSDYASAHLILEIAEKCHRLVINGSVWAKYSKHLEDLKQYGKGGTLNVMKILKQMMTNVDKVKYADDAPLLQYEREVPEDDRIFVRLANHLRAVLVTNDARLVENLLNSDFIRKYPIQIVAPRDALKYALTDC